MRRLKTELYARTVPSCEVSETFVRITPFTDVSDTPPFLSADISGGWIAQTYIYIGLSKTFSVTT